MCGLAEVAHSHQQEIHRVQLTTSHHPHLPKNLVIAGDREDTRSELQKLDEVAYYAELKYTELSIDHEACWVLRGNVSRFGFKHHVLTDPICGSP